MLKRIISIALAVIFTFLLIPFNSFANAAVVGALTRADIAKYLAAAYLAAADTEYSDITLQDLSFYVTTADNDNSVWAGYTLCPLWVDDKHLSFEHVVFKTVSTDVAGPTEAVTVYSSASELSSSVNDTFIKSCLTPQIVSAYDSKDIPNAPKPKSDAHIWARHGSLGVTASQYSQSDTFEGIGDGYNVPKVYPIYSWANLSNQYSYGNDRRFSRLYCVSNTIRPAPDFNEEQILVDMYPYAVSGYHLMLYAKMMHTILSDDITIGRVQTYVENNYAKYEKHVAAGQSISQNDDGIWKRLKNYSFSNSTKDLLYQALTIATTRGAGDHCKTGTYDQFAIAADMFSSAKVSNNQESTQRSFFTTCCNNADIFGADVKAGTKYGFVKNALSKALSPYMRDALGKINELMEKNSNLDMKKDGIRSPYECLNHLLGEDSIGASDFNAAAVMMFSTLMSEGNSWSLNTGWFEDATNAKYWTYDRVSGVYGAFVNDLGGASGVYIPASDIGATEFSGISNASGAVFSTDSTVSEAFARIQANLDTEKNICEMRGVNIMRGGHSATLSILSGLRHMSLYISNKAEDYIGKNIHLAGYDDVSNVLQAEFGIRNAIGLRWLINLLGNGDYSANDFKEVEKSWSNAETNGYTLNRSLSSCVEILLDTLSRVDKPKTLGTLYADIITKYPESAKTSSIQDAFKSSDGVRIGNDTYTLDSALKKYCTTHGQELKAHYTHYCSILRKYGDVKSLAPEDSTMADPNNPLIKNKLAQLENKYKSSLSSPLSEGLKIFDQVLAQSEVLDYYSEQGILVDETDENSLFAMVVKDINKNIPNGNARSSFYSGSFTHEQSYYTYAYQLLLGEEIIHPAFNVYSELANDIINNGGSSMSTLQDYIRCVDTIHTIVEKYPSELTYGLWYDERGIDGEETEEEGEENDLGTFAALYDYLINMGLLNGDEYMTDIYDESNPLTVFFMISNGGNVRFAKDYYKGRALSSSFLPMQTNTYDPYAYLEYMDTDWIETFQYNYGFHRKALMIDTNVDAAVDSYVTGTSGSTRVATLKDLFNPESDIVLYVDDNFYNLSTLAEQQDKAYDRFANVEGSPVEELMQDVSNFFTDMFEVRFEVALKQGEYDIYSDKLKKNVSGMSYSTPSVPASSSSSESSETVKKKKYDDYILNREVATEYLVYPDRYTEMMGFAFVSMVYRDDASYTTLNNASVAHKPVFVSSPTLATVSGVTDQQRASIYNYALLKNLPAMCTVGANQSLDMNSPIYTDIYGNIVTESGVVVIPAACNATIHEVANGYIPMTSGFLASYGKEWKIPLDWKLDETFMKQFFIKNEEDGVWDVRNRTIQGVELALAELSYSDTTVNQALIDYYTWDINNASTINDTTALNTVHEVMRGAPIENIDFAEEGLGGQRYDKSGLIAAAKLDSIINSLKWDEDNSIMSVPNLSFIDNYQYVVTIIFKILLVIVVVAMMLTVYIDVMKAHVSLKTFWKCLSILLLGTLSVLLVPVSYDIAYYQSNKALLQDEAEYILMLNTEKQLSGREIGISTVEEPKDNTKIYIKLEDYAFDWVEVLPKVIFSDSIDVLNEEYQEFLESSLLCKEDIMQPMNDGIYVDVQDLFETSSVLFDTTNKGLYHTISIEPVVSHYLPYYYFLDSLILNVNKFNHNNNVYAYSTKIMRGGKVGTINLVGTYFNSKKFDEAEDMDYLGLYQLYDKMGSMYVDKMFEDESIEDARRSQWYVGTLISEKESEKRIEIMNMKVKEFVAKHRDLIGRVTDETFLKVMAMSLALDYNDLYGIPSASAYEVYNLSNTDLMRLTVSDKATTLEGSPMSFARFVYTEAGTPGVYAAVFLVVVTMFVQTMKTIITIAIMALLIVSVFVFKILLRRQSSSVAGYLLTLLVICSTNILYAVILKISLLIPQTGLAPTLCIIIQIIVQLAYLALLGLVLSFAVRDWKNAGFTFYQGIGSTIRDKANGLFRRHKMTPQERYDSKPRGKDGWDYYRKLVNDNEKRIKKVGNH